VPELTRRFNAKFGVQRTPCAIRSIVHNHGFRCGRAPGFAKGERIFLNKRQEAYIRNQVRRHTHAETTDLLNSKFATSFSVRQVQCFCKNHNINSGRTGYFSKGHRPWNAGTKGEGLTGRNRTTFSTGHVPANLRPIGSERIDLKDGYVLVKVKETNPHTGAPTRFRAKHIVLWEKKHGPVPAGHAVIFKDGVKTHIVLKNLELVKRAELARLNYMKYSQVPTQLKPTVLALAKLKTRVGELRRGVA